MNIIVKICELIFIPLIVVLTNYCVQWLKVKIENLNIMNNVKDKELKDKYLNSLYETINDCVLATNQTYVNSLKKQGAFTAETQVQAFQETYNTVLKLLDTETKKYLNEITNDMQTYLTTRIEAAVNLNKI